jgi:hypothetical protein
MPDMLVFHASRTIGIELKSYKGKLTAAQKLTHERLHRAGVHVAVCSSLDEVITILKLAGIPLRRTRGASDAA